LEIAHEGAIIQTIRIKEMIQGKAIHDPANREAIRQFRARGLAVQLRKQAGDLGNRRLQTHSPQQIRQSLALARMTDGVEFELHVQEHALQISTQFAEVLGQSLDTLMGVWQAEQ
jgi:hypothetical protein